MFDSRIVCCYLYPITRYGYPPPAERTTHYLDEMHALGFRSVELEGIREPHLRAMHRHRHAVRDRLDALGMGAPYFCAVLPELASPDSAERAHALDLFGLGCTTARTLGADGILDNAPLPPYRFPDGVPVVRHYDEDVLTSAALPDGLVWNRYWDDLARTYRAACDRAADDGLTVQVHPCLGALASTAEGFLLFADAVDRPNLRFNLDTANLFVRKDHLALALRRLAGRIDYIHLSDNRGIRTEHLVPGEGAIDWNVFFATLRDIEFDGRIGLDVGGAESEIVDLDDAYTRAARWLTTRWP